MYKYIISACLSGVNCRYNGSNYLIKSIAKLVKEGKAISICPEIIAGLSTPRTSCEIEVVNGKRKVYNKKGQELTRQFINAAHKCVDLARIFEIKQAILKSRSPSCGSKYIYDGSFSGNLKPGKGITAEYLIKNGIKVFNENQINELVD
ncbi:MAG: DUF523 domain-containing protein [Halanaerobiaceae bacterium]